MTQRVGGGESVAPVSPDFVLDLHLDLFLDLCLDFVAHVGKDLSRITQGVLRTGHEAV